MAARRDPSAWHIHAVMKPRVRESVGALPLWTSPSLCHPEHTSPACTLFSDTQLAQLGRRAHKGRAELQGAPPSPECC